MSRKDAVALAARTLGVLLTVWALAEVASLPSSLYSFLHYMYEARDTAGTGYLRHLYLINLGFTVTKAVGFALMALWLRKSGPEVEELLLPSEDTSFDNVL